MPNLLGAQLAIDDSSSVILKYCVFSIYRHNNRTIRGNRKLKSVNIFGLNSIKLLQLKTLTYIQSSLIASLLLNNQFVYVVRHNLIVHHIIEWTGYKAPKTAHVSPFISWGAVNQLLNWKPHSLLGCYVYITFQGCGYRKCPASSTWFSLIYSCQNRFLRPPIELFW